VTFPDQLGRVIGEAGPTPLIDPPVTPGPGERAVADLMVGSQRLGDCRPVTFTLSRSGQEQRPTLDQPTFGTSDAYVVQKPGRPASAGGPTPKCRF
jgi:hypothetical protein